MEHKKKNTQTQRRKTQLLTHKLKTKKNKNTRHKQNKQTQHKKTTTIQKKTKLTKQTPTQQN